MRLRSPRLALLLAAVFAFYLWTAATGWRPLAFPSDPGRPGTSAFAGNHNLLAQAFLAGHLYLTIPPDPRLLALPDPYDPGQNHLYRLPASLYKDRYYLYWGPAPVLLLFLPFRAPTGLYFPENLAGVLFCFTSLLFSTATLLFFYNDAFSRPRPLGCSYWPWPP